MIPIGDDKLHNARKPFVTILLILANILIFWQEVTMDPKALETFIGKYAAIPALIENGQNLPSLLTSMFLHGGWMHLIGNMLFLWVFGDNIEAALGHFGYLLFYVLAGLAGSIAHVMTNLGDPTPSLGASGAISGCMGAYIMMFPTSRIRMLIPIIFMTLRVSAWLFIGVWIAMQIFSSTVGQDPEGEGGGVAWWAHIGGFAFGVVVGLLFRGRAKNLVGVRREEQQRRRWI